MLLQGMRGQPNLDSALDFSGSIATGGAAQLALNQQPGRCYLYLQNTSSAILTVGMGPATATATLSGETVSSVAVANKGIGYTVPPQVLFLGGQYPGDLQHAPSDSAKGFAVLSSDTIKSVTVSHAGSGYSVAPYVLFVNPAPSLGGGAYLPSASAGIVLSTNAALIMETSFVTTDPIAVYGDTTGQTYVCKVVIG